MCKYGNIEMVAKMKEFECFSIECSIVRCTFEYFDDGNIHIFNLYLESCYNAKLKLKRKYTIYAAAMHTPHHSHYSNIKTIFVHMVDIHRLPMHPWKTVSPTINI